MAANGLVQSAVAPTSVNSPASVVPTLGAASQVGTTLLISITMTGATPTCATPANWALESSVTSAACSTFVFSFKRNPGGITAVTLTLSNTTNGGAVASIFEFSGTGTVVTTELATGFSGSFTTITQSLAAQAAQGELVFFCVGFVSTATVSANNNSQEYSANTSGGTSTVATTNVTLVNYWGNTNVSPGVESITLSGAVAMATVTVRFITQGSSPIVEATNAGNRGIYVGAFNQGMIGG